MSYTPETKSSTFQKFSPFGVGISKTLLTPCRRVGLSRKRGSQSTPTSLTKTPTEISNESLLNEDSKTTPVSYDHSDIKGKYAHSLSKDIQLEKRKFLDNKSVIKNSSCKKVLAQNFSVEKCDQASDHTDKIRDLGILTTDDNTIDLQIEKGQDNLTVREENREMQEKLKNSQNNKEESISEHVNKISPENAQGVKTEGKENSNSSLEDSNSNLKNKKKGKLDKNEKPHKSREKIPPTRHLKACSVALERLDSETSVKAKSFITSDDENSFDNEFVVRKKKKIVIEDDNDNIDRSSKHEVSNSLSKVVSNLHEDDEDMAFTSTPEQDKNEKKKLIQIVTDMENSIKEKKKRLEDLTQASIYKNKHNIDELDTLTKIWKTGCESGLKSLLKQLQSHGPMDMATLLEKLHIPPDVAGQLSLSDS
nr:unnamed protein product [Callosobruchus chinensis]